MRGQAGRGRICIPDAELEWAMRMYFDNAPIRAAMDLDDFLAAPHVAVRAHLTPCADDTPHRLLPCQARIARRIEHSDLMAETARQHRRGEISAARHSTEELLPSDTCHRGGGWLYATHASPRMGDQLRARHQAMTDTPVESTSLRDVEALAKRHAEARDVLIERMQHLDGALADVRREHVRGLKGALGRVAQTEAELRAAIDGARTLFTKPKSRVLHGLKVGLRKQPGKLSWQNVGQVLKLIRKHHPDDADLLIRTKEEPARDALKQLSAAALKRLGIQVTETSDAVEIRAVDSAVDKWVDAMLDGLRGDLESAGGDAA